MILMIHIQIPDQQYCDQMLKSKDLGAFGTVYYIESLHPYDYSFNQSKCIYDKNENFIANPNYSIWGIRV